MSKPTTEEMLEWLRMARTGVIDTWNLIDVPDAIRALIFASDKESKESEGKPLTGYIGNHFKKVMEESDKGPEVDEEFLQRWEDNFATDIGEVGSPKFVGPNKKGLAKMFHEAGVRVKEGK